MHQEAINLLTQEVCAAQKRAAAIKLEIDKISKSMGLYDSAISVLKGQSSSITGTKAPRVLRGGERLEDRVLAEIKKTNGTKAKFIALKLTENGRPTGETTVSCLVSRLVKRGAVLRLNGLVYSKI